MCYDSLSTITDVPWSLLAQSCMMAMSIACIDDNSSFFAVLCVYCRDNIMHAYVLVQASCEKTNQHHHEWAIQGKRRKSSQSLPMKAKVYKDYNR